MHRNTYLSMGLVFIAVALLAVCSCGGGSTVQDLSDFEGVWDLHCEGTGVLTDFNNPGPRHVSFDKVYSIYPNKIQDNKAYDWDWAYDGSNLQFELLRTIPIADYSCGALLLQGNAQFSFPNPDPSAVTISGMMTLGNGSVVCENNPSEEGTVTGTFSVYMVKR